MKQDYDAIGSLLGRNNYGIKENITYSKNIKRQGFVLWPPVRISPTPSLEFILKLLFSADFFAVIRAYIKQRNKIRTVSPFLLLFPFLLSVSFFPPFSSISIFPFSPVIPSKFFSFFFDFCQKWGGGDDDQNICISILSDKWRYLSFKEINHVCQFMDF